MHRTFLIADTRRQTERPTKYRRRRYEVTQQVLKFSFKYCVAETGKLTSSHQRQQTPTLNDK